MKKLVHLVVEVVQLERNEVLPPEIRSFHLIFVYFFGHNQSGISVFSISA